MKIRLDLTAADLRDLNNPETTEEVITEAHNILDQIFNERHKLIKCSIVVDGDKE